MRINMPLTQRENNAQGKEELITSKTNLKGIITYANASLCRISGFSEHELIGSPHNIMRHPDMPCVAFAWMWDNLESGQYWQAMVKNRCKNGDHYWVEASVYPQFDAGGRICGYQSTCREPSRSQIDDAASLYAMLRQAEEKMAQHGPLTREAMIGLYRDSSLYQV